MINCHFEIQIDQSQIKCRRSFTIKQLHKYPYDWILPSVNHDIYKLQTITKPTYCELEEYIQGSTDKNGRDWYSHFTSETRSYGFAIHLYRNI
jgi:hypothetical protein